MRQEIIKKAKEMRIEQSFTTAYVAKFLGISEKDYLKFEEGNGAPDDDYFILSGLSYLYGVSLESLFKTAKDKAFFTGMLGEYTEFDSATQEIFQNVLSGLETVDKEEFLNLEDKMGGFKFPYTTPEDKVEYLVLVENDKTDGYYFVVLNGLMKIAKFVIYGGEECFEVNDRIYPMRLSNLKVFAKIYAKLKLGDV